MNQARHIEKPSFDHAVEVGEVVETGGYHQPGTAYDSPHCGCKLTTEKGAYRDVVVEMPDGRVVHFYHQSPVVVVDGERYRLDSAGWNTRSTKDRINSVLPSGFRVVGKDSNRRSAESDWRLVTPDEAAHPFEDGMVVEVRDPFEVRA